MFRPMVISLLLGIKACSPVEDLLRAQAFALWTGGCYKIEQSRLQNDSPLELPVNCEDVTLYLDDSIARVGQMPETYLIAVARLGKAESNYRLNRIRLNAVEAYIRRKSNLKYVMAEGSRANALGRIEIYVGGRLAYVMPIKRNATSFCPTPVG